MTYESEQEQQVVLVVDVTGLKCLVAGPPAPILDFEAGGSPMNSVPLLVVGRHASEIVSVEVPRDRSELPIGGTVSVHGLRAALGDRADGAIRFAADKIVLIDSSESCPPTEPSESDSFNKLDQRHVGDVPRVRTASENAL